MSKPELMNALRELESYGLIHAASDDGEIEEAIDELGLSDGEDGGREG